MNFPKKTKTPFEAKSITRQNVAILEQCESRLDKLGPDRALTVLAELTDTFQKRQAALRATTPPPAAVPAAEALADLE